MSGNKKQQQFEERRKYVTAFNSTMVKIWKERITLLGIIDTGALYRSVIATHMRADGRFSSVHTASLLTEAQVARLPRETPATLAETRSASLAHGSIQSITAHI